MAKLPVKPVANFAIKHGPTVAKIISDNQHHIKNGMDILSDFVESKRMQKEQKAAERTVPYMEQHYKLYNDEILPSLDTYLRSELLSFRVDVQKILEQIDVEKKKDAKPKAVFHNKKSKKWQQVFTQIEGKLNAKDYEEYLRLYHTSDSESVYFKDHEQNIATFKKLLAENDSDKILVYLSKQTNMSSEDITRDFFLEFS
ncbi:hypothetical protein NM897_04665 [Planococcus maritimus]|uniref:hypothetical protein n=1 Tax=Planococcus maritimus TaxID=192421 RepID=UPI00313863B8